MKFPRILLALAISALVGSVATSATIPNHVPLGEADDTLTSPSMVNRQVLPFSPPADKTLFKEIVPCYLTWSTGNYLPTPHTEWVYAFAAPLIDPLNECAGKIPQTGVVALTIQVRSLNDGTTNGYFTFQPPYNNRFVPQLFSVLQNTTAFLFYEGGTNVVQAGTVQIGSDYLLHLWNEGGTSNVEIQILGYHLNDPLVGTVGADGRNGRDGAASTVPGPAGAASTVPGPKGDTGATGAGLPGKDGRDGANGANGTNGVCSCPWACSNVCAPASAALDARSPLWAKCTVVLGTNPGVLNFVLDGTPQVYSHACGRPCAPETITIDKGSTYCFMSLPDPA